jgi:hypothetical protein
VRGSSFDKLTMKKLTMREVVDCLNIGSVGAWIIVCSFGSLQSTHFPHGELLHRELVERRTTHIAEPVEG